MSDDDVYNVKRLNSAPPVYNKLFVKSDEKHEKKHDHQQQPKESKDYFQLLAKAAARSNEILIRQKQPYRFRVYQEGEEVFIDLVVLGEDGSVKSEVKKNITHESFIKWIDDISHAEGVFFDGTV